VINPEALIRVVEAGTLYGLSRALHEEVKFDAEKVTLRHEDTPERIDVVIGSGDPNPNRPDLQHYETGETVCKPMLAAVANAVFDATGVRMRRMPLYWSPIRPGPKHRTAKELDEHQYGCGSLSKMGSPVRRPPPAVSEHVDVAVIGAGPAGLAAGAFFSARDIEFVVLDSGSGAEERRRDDPRSLVSGVGGAGLYSDGKFSFFPSATQLWSLSEQARVRGAYDWIAALLTAEGMIVPPFPEAFEDNRQPAGDFLKSYPSNYLPFENRERIGKALSSRIGKALRTRHDVVGIRAQDEGYRLSIETPEGLKAISARHVLMATGRFGARDFARMLPDLPMVFRRHEIGIRLEQQAASFMFATHPSLDVKLISPADLKHGEWRTFCTCRDGEVVQTAWRDCLSFSGRADGAKSGRSNIGVNLRIAAPPGGALEREIWNVVNGHSMPFSVSAESYIGGARPSTFLGESLDCYFREKILDLVDPSLLGETQVFGPCIEGVGYYPDINESLKVNSQDIWVAGDAAGLFRGLTAAFVSGHYVASALYDHSASSRELPRFVKHSPSLPMPVVFTAQSKAYFYCRDAICEFAIREGYLPLNPFRVFEYFLGDRVDRNLVRQGNNQLVSISDELWVFGPVSDGVLFEVVRARRLRKPIRFFSVGTRADDIKPVSPTEVKFEPEVHAFQIRREDLVALLTDTLPGDRADLIPTQLGLTLD
jgi:hypothetical protein